jgi:arsenate reductase
MPLPLFETPTLLHNPRCSKSRAAKALLDESGVTYQERLYLEQPLSAAELAELRKWMRAGEPAHGEAGLTKDSDDAAILKAMARHPILIERPIFILKKHAAVGRPVEKIAALLEQEE